MGIVCQGEQMALHVDLKNVRKLEEESVACFGEAVNDYRFSEAWETKSLKGLTEKSRR